MDEAVTRRGLLATVGVTALSGCGSITDPGRSTAAGTATSDSEQSIGGDSGGLEQCMPPVMDFDVSYEQSRSDGAIVVTVTRRTSLATDRIRVTVGDTVAYDGGVLHPAYAAGANASDGWGEEATEGERLVLSTEGPIPGYRSVSVELRSACDSWDQRRRSETPPPPMTISATAERIDGTAYLTITHEGGIDFSAEHIEVLVPGVEGLLGYVRGSVTDPADGPAVVDEWSDGISPGDRLRLATPEGDPADGVVSVEWYGHPDGEGRTIARTTVQGDISTPSETSESMPTGPVTGTSH